MDFEITALDIQSRNTVSFHPDVMWIIPGDKRAMACLPNSALIAELDLTKPAEGWKIYPN